MKVYSEVLAFQIESVMRGDWRHRVHQARANITDSNGWGNANGSFVFSSSPIALDHPWLIDSLVGRDVYFGYPIRELDSREHFELRRPSLQVGGEVDVFSEDQVEEFLTETFGVNSENGPHAAKRTYASAGGLYPVQVLVARHVGGGSWETMHFIPALNAVEELGSFKESDLARYVGEMGDFLPSRSAFLVAYLVLPPIVLAKYGPRGYKFALIEVGAMQETARRSGQERGWGSRPYGFYDEQSISHLFGLDPDRVWIEGLQFFGSEDCANA